MPSHTYNPQNTCGRTTRFLRKNLPALPHGLTNASHSVLAHQWAYTSPFQVTCKNRNTENVQKNNKICTNIQYGMKNHPLFL